MAGCILKIVIAKGGRVCIYFGEGKVLIHHTFPKKTPPHSGIPTRTLCLGNLWFITQARVVRELGLEPSFQYKQNGGRGWFSSCEETKGLQEQILSG